MRSPFRHRIGGGVSSFPPSPPTLLAPSFLSLAVATGGCGEGDGGGRRRGVGKGLLDDIPSSPIPLDLRRRLPIRSLKPPPPAAAANEEEEAEAASSPARKEMERRTESKSSWNPPMPADSSRRMVRLSAASGARVWGTGSNGELGGFGGVSALRDVARRF
jgi:hypothetical protein